jgi:hypothetical protein
MPGMSGTRRHEHCHTPNRSPVETRAQVVPVDDYRLTRAPPRPWQVPGLECPVRRRCRDNSERPRRRGGRGPLISAAVRSIASLRRPRGSRPAPARAPSPVFAGVAANCRTNDRGPTSPVGRGTGLPVAQSSQRPCRAESRVTAAAGPLHCAGSARSTDTRSRPGPWRWLPVQGTRPGSVSVTPNGARPDRVRSSPRRVASPPTEPSPQPE